MSDALDDAAGLSIGSLANDEIVAASSDITIREAAAKLDAEEIGLLILQDGSEIAGVISERDIVHAVATGADLDAPASSAAGDRDLLWAEPSSSVADVAQEMMESYVRHVLLAGPDKRPVGIVSMRDLLAVVID